MKKQLIVLFLAFLAISSASQAQDSTATKNVAGAKNLKIGYTNVNYILSVSPRAKEIEADLKTRGIQLKKEIDSKMQSLEAKYADYQKNAANMLESIRVDKENELRTLQSSIETLQQNAQTELKNKEDELLKPEIEKIYKAINDVAIAEGFTYVLNSDQVLLYAVEQFDVTEQVAKKLGFKLPAAGETKSTAAPSNNAAKPATSPAKKPTTSPKKGK